jgi:hypothetical protein
MVSDITIRRERAITKDGTKWWERTKLDEDTNSGERAILPDGTT